MIGLPCGEEIMTTR